MSELPPGRYRAQAVLDQNRSNSSWRREAGNLYSDVVPFEITSRGVSTAVQLRLDRITTANDPARSRRRPLHQRSFQTAQRAPRHRSLAAGGCHRAHRHRPRETLPRNLRGARLRRRPHQRHTQSRAIPGTPTPRATRANSRATHTGSCSIPRAPTATTCSRTRRTTAQSARRSSKNSSRRSMRRSTQSPSTPRVCSAATPRAGGPPSGSARPIQTRSAACGLHRPIPLISARSKPSTSTTRPICTATKNSARSCGRRATPTPTASRG